MKNTVAVVELDKTGFIIRASAHALERMAQRHVNKSAIAQSITALGKDRLVHLQETGEDAIVIDNDKHISIVFAVKNYQIHIITVINKSNVFVKNHTEIIKL